jgi:serpin B
MTDAEQLYIDAVIHQANIDVDEKGTTAAAATAIVMRAGSAPGDLVELRVDRPFLFALRDVPTGAILFLGRVMEPEVRS